RWRSWPRRSGSRCATSSRPSRDSAGARRAGGDDERADHRETGARGRQHLQGEVPGQAHRRGSRVRDLDDQVFRPRKGSSGETSWKNAKRLLDKRLGEVREGTYIGPEADRTTYEYLEQLVLNNYTANRRRSLKRLQLSCAHLKAFFG